MKGKGDVWTNVGVLLANREHVNDSEESLRGVHMVGSMDGIPVADALRRARAQVQRPRAALPLILIPCLETTKDGMTVPKFPVATK